MSAIHEAPSVASEVEISSFPTVRPSRRVSTVRLSVFASPHSKVELQAPSTNDPDHRQLHLGLLRSLSSTAIEWPHSILVAASTLSWNCGFCGKGEIVSFCDCLLPHYINVGLIVGCNIIREGVFREVTLEFLEFMTSFIWSSILHYLGMFVELVN